MAAYSVRGRALAGLAALSLLLAACGDGPKAGPMGGPGGGQAGLADYLAGLPAVLTDGEDGLIQVAVADLDRAAELAGVTRPAGAADPEAVGEYLRALSGQFADAPPVAAMFPEAANVTRVEQVAEFDAEVGWSIADVSWFAEYQVQPHTFTVLGGDVDAGRLTAALGERPDDGIWRIGGEDFAMDVSQVSAARPLGQALRLALVEDWLVVARSTPPVAAALDGEPTLAEHPVLSALAVGLDGEDAYSAMLLAGEPEQFRSPPTTPEGEPEGGLPEPFTGVAVGSTVVDDSPYAVFVYRHADGDAATANADALRTLLEEGRSSSGQPWRDRFGVDEIRVDGATVIARLTLGEAPPLTAYQVLLRRDNLVSQR